MKERKKGKDRGLWVFIVLTVAIVLPLRTFLLYRELKVVSLAKDYLSQKYEQKMKYEGMWRSWIGRSVYHVYFSPADKPDLDFEVLVQQNFTINDKIREFGKSGCADNYYVKYFEYKMEELLGEYAKELWGDDIKLNVTQLESGLYSFHIPEGLNDSLSAEEAEPFAGKYSIGVKTDKLTLDEQGLETSAKQIFEFVQVIKSDGFNPEWLSLEWPSSEKRKVVVLYLQRFDEINTADQIEALLKDESIRREYKWGREYEIWIDDEDANWDD